MIPTVKFKYKLVYFFKNCNQLLFPQYIFFYCIVYYFVLEIILARISYKHSDGTSYPGMFIAGISTFWGDATYHVEGKYLPLFASIPMRDKAPEYDGHTPEEALDRIFRCFCSDLHEDMIKRK